MGRHYLTLALPPERVLERNADEIADRILRQFCQLLVAKLCPRSMGGPGGHRPQREADHQQRRPRRTLSFRAFADQVMTPVRIRPISTASEPHGFDLRLGVFSPGIGPRSHAATWVVFIPGLPLISVPKVPVWLKDKLGQLRLTDSLIERGFLSAAMLVLRGAWRGASADSVEKLPEWFRKKSLEL
jgi:hypothetical protein